MGSWISRLFGKKSEAVRLLMLGLDAAGKTTILYQLKIGESVTTIPTVGFNVETVQHKKLQLNVWDVGGQEKIRPLWRHYYAGTDALIFVVDSCDHDRLDEAKEEMHRIINDRDLSDAPILVYANKQDRPQAMPAENVAEALDMHSLTARSWHVQGSCAISGEGLLLGLTWISEQLKARSKSKKK